MQEARRRLDSLVKPKGSLGVLEELAVRLAGMAGCCPPPLPRPAAVLVFAADHGVARRGVSAYPAWVTARMLEVFARGGAAINALARQLQAELWVVDVGTAGRQPPAGPGPAAGARLVPARVQPGTADFTRQPAMERHSAAQALLTGRRLTRQAVQAGARLLAFGEMGIANTTAASAVVAALMGADPAEVVGPGTGLEPAGVARKAEVVRQALRRHRPRPDDPLGVLAAVGGLEVAALAGGLLEAASLRVPAVLDGFVVAAAALAAARLCPQASGYWVAGHRSPEPGHRLALAQLGLRPLLELEMRLGEATGAALALPVVEAAARLCREMWTLEQAGVIPP